MDTSQLQPLKKRIQQEVGVKYGFDKSTSERQSIEQLIEQLVALNPTEEPAGMDLTGTSWRPIYTTSTGTSGGKLGPFIAEVSQDFPADQPGFYFNKLALGPLRAELLADYKKVRADRLDVEFKYTDFFLGPFKRRQEFPPGRMRGYWRIAYSDGDMRVFYTNKGSLFVLVRVQQ